ncbi:DUF3857 domain-containing protein [Mucilaginibacter xinganensis]|uniref:DUF3857 domain-containing protein n=1 Tax=Mucilaginibacter xinganensis TaxID=1234841 RepID=A0A223NXA1_9SPHI|nr:DUF3857 domain-containing protein [Mucilaginibacter xinganensis]ASU34456.1 DUF3857 domain-containing protein [Mucilaginibacter xinganensis]
MRKPLLITLILIFSCCILSAQDFPYGTISIQEMNMKNYAKDTSAHAVVLQEFGKSSINIGSDDHIKLMYEYHVKIKIFDSKAFEKGTIQIPVYNGSDNDAYEEASDITGVTYYKDDNGLTQKVELENKKIYPVKENKYWANYKFALPGLRNGCVIEYKYKVESPYWYKMRPWHFQEDIPKLYSEYEVHIPAFFNFNASLKGPLKLTTTKSSIESGCFETHGAKADCSLINYGMADVPAFVEDDYMTSPNNFKSTVNFELVDWTSPYDGIKHKETKEWRDIDYSLKTESEFGGQLKRKGLLKDKIAPIIAGKTDDLSKAKAIYKYWQKWFKWNDFIGIYSQNISKAYDTHSGSVADINLSLVTALSAAGLNADAVLLSTRNNGALNTLYPAIGDFNYVIAKVDIGGQSYLLDATDPLLPFGMLPFKCLNDKGRVFSLDKPSYFMDMSLPQREKSSYILDVTLQDNGKLKGTLTDYSSGYEAYKKRVAIKKFNSNDEYIENLNGKLPKWKLLKAEIRNLDSLDMPVTEQYDVEIDLYKNIGESNKLTFNPYYFGRISTNPLKLNERSYPIDMGMASEERYVITLHLPLTYTVETPPQPLAISIPNNGGRYISSYEPGDNSFSFVYVTQYSKSVYGAEEYPYLKEFFNKIIQSQKAEMVFKKK